MYWCCCVCVRAGKVVSRTMVVNGSVSLSTATGAMNLFLLRPSTKRYHAVGSVSRKSPVSTENEIGKSGFLHGSRKIALSIHLFSTEHAHSVEKSGRFDWMCPSDWSVENVEKNIASLIPSPQTHAHTPIPGTKVPHSSILQQRRR